MNHVTPIKQFNIPSWERKVHTTMSFLERMCWCNTYEYSCCSSFKVSKKKSSWEDEILPKLIKYTADMFLIWPWWEREEMVPKSAFFQTLIRRSASWILVVTLPGRGETVPAHSQDEGNSRGWRERKLYWSKYLMNLMEKYSIMGSLWCFNMSWQRPRLRRNIGVHLMGLHSLSSQN